MAEPGEAGRDANGPALRLQGVSVAYGDRRALDGVDLAVRHCDRVVGLRHGRVVLDVPAADVDERTREWLYDLTPDP